jgi:hypothetical protein
MRVVDTRSSRRSLAREPSPPSRPTGPSASSTEPCHSTRLGTATRSYQRCSPLGAARLLLAWVREPNAYDHSHHPTWTHYIALRDLAADEEITGDRSTLEQCNCGAAACRWQRG